MLAKGLFRACRLVATGASFVLFGIGALVLGYLVFPLVSLLSSNRLRTARRCRYLVHLSFRGFIHFMRITGIFTWEVQNRAQLQIPGQLVVANHPSLIDIVFLISIIPNATCIVKADLYRNVFTRGPVSWAGYIPNNSAEQLLEDGKAELDRGTTMVVFPQGTRSVQGETVRFRRGAAYLWLRSHCLLSLVNITVSPPMLGKRDKWYTVPAQRPHFKLEAKPETAQAVTEKQGDARTVTRRWQQYFTREITT